ncbi:MAG TPA: protein-glutamate O-methyltransferase CheR [Elusimicrobiota bacterium]|nr:protein-glutamate O-methyltransferase CheR [Elusimicrobiota bacterium]
MEQKWEVFNDIKAYLKGRGLHCDYYRDAYLERRLVVRLKKCGKTSFADYLSHLRSDPAECQKLTDCLLVNVSSFFRDGTPFENLQRNIFPRLSRRAAQEGRRALRVWSAACATGEEPYSIAMSAHEAIPDFFARGDKLKIVASDIDEESLKSARRGEYPAKTMQGVEDRLLRKYFSRKGASYAVMDFIRESVHFVKNDLIGDMPPWQGLDLILCRNMLIYIHLRMQEHILGKLWGALGAGGVLILGKSEVLPGSLAEKFEEVSPQDGIYFKR